MPADVTTRQGIASEKSGMVGFDRHESLLRLAPGPTLVPSAGPQLPNNEKMFYRFGSQTSLNGGMTLDVAGRHFGGGNSIPSGSPLGLELSTRRVDELKIHPSCARNQVMISTDRLSAIEAIGDMAFQTPIVVTHGGLIIFGYEEYTLALQRGLATLSCFDYDVDEDQSLRMLLALNRSSKGFNAFQRTQLALDLEPSLKSAAAANQSKGGKHRGLQRLARDSHIHVREEIAKIAGVCAWNVDKVKFVLQNGTPEIRKAAREGELSINLAWKLSRGLPEVQLEDLRRRRLNKGMSRIVRKYVAERQREMLSASVPETSTLGLEALIDYLTRGVRNGTIAVMPVDQASGEILLPREVLAEIQGTMGDFGGWR